MGINDYSSTPSANTTINGINIDEGCPPGNINDAIRQQMADVAAAGLTNVATQSEHNSPAGVEKLARLDRLEEAGWIGAGKVIQEVHNTHTTAASSSSGGWANTGFEVIITPKRSDSVIEVIAYLPRASVRRVSGTIIERTGDLRIQNQNSGDSGPEFLFGRNLSSGSGNAAVSYGLPPAHYREASGDVSARTYRVQMRSASTDVEVNTNANTTSGICTIIAREIAQ